MKTGTVNHDHHPLYWDYDRALDQWKKAEKLWFRVVNKRATSEEKTAFEDHLRAAEFLFTYLARQSFLSADSYLLKIEARHQKLANMERYAEARRWFNEAGGLKRKSDLPRKRELYQRAWNQFYALGDYPCAELYAKRAEENYLDTFKVEDNNALDLSFFHVSRPVVPAAETSDKGEAKEAVKPDKPIQDGPWRVLIEGGYDLCIRPKLPGAGAELFTTTVITPEGAFQWCDAQGYVCILASAALQALQLKPYLDQARFLLPGKSGRKSIRSALSREQLQVLDQALVAKGGRSLEEPESERMSFKTNFETESKSTRRMI